MSAVHGLQIFKPAGVLHVDLTTRVGEFLGSFDTNGQATGQIADARLIGRELVAAPVNQGSSNAFGGPVIRLNKATGVVSWEFLYEGTAFPPTSASMTFRVFYGRY